MRQAIVTKYLGPTNTRGSRVKATASAGSVTIEWDDAINTEANHNRAAMLLAYKYKWAGDYIGGGLPNGDCVFVCKRS